VIDFRFTLPTAEVANVYIEKEVTERTAFGERKRRVKRRRRRSSRSISRARS